MTDTSERGVNSLLNLRKKTKADVAPKLTTKHETKPGAHQEEIAMLI